MVRGVGEALASGLVGDADLHRLEGVEHVQLGEGDLRERVQPHRLAGHDRVEPAAAAAPAGVGAELVAPLDQQVAHVVVELGREGPAPTRVM